ncbi:heteromeric transposase endonuclease subunit TnsA [Desulfosporosinus sp. BICA1-9]|uniref:heteromeric transposase endonuclease subunit TnsA n=1 Tax=Desulfosporosinus sp. BICA1-9 TaxID=1531958 RepID=UPI00054B96AD|nr:heteromeric transposase endonuclease subunit TnsA [Desulfosporosinus sp. BICA1-9]KJS49312.1 MAG: hypothetical protein VR66_09210 [Peptococcaceae bacterium BRH_c23]KJS89879.1 MAG: hypothetical protein JL57_05075 [Desulfosporosinus sp. BICA1-9]HBW33906.1 heteromeric transposase endonuclease subunit TnsA [Desulfosporosinus sp.]
MPGGKSLWNEAKFKRYLKEGRGQGIGADYIPWHRVQDFNSRGRTSRGPGWKTGREHQLFSDLETNYFYMLEWEDSVTDIREQYPLLDLELAMRIAEEIGVKYPARQGFPWMLTTDFLINTVVNGKEVTIARTVKPSEDLEKRRILEKFEIERRYWQTKDIDWAIVTENEIQRQVSRNIEWLHPYKRLEPTESLSQDDLIYYAEIIKRELDKSAKPIRIVLTQIEKNHNLNSGTGIYLFKHLLACKDIKMNMGTKIYEGCSAADILSIHFEHEEAIV